jgi:FkbM family methyltransferase
VTRCYHSAVSATYRARRALWGIRHESRWGWRHLTRGRWTYLVNVLVYRWLAVAGQPSMKRAGSRLCRLETDQGLVLWYRRDRGDLQGIREILIDEIYRLPDGAVPTSLLDLGAHIGIATVWLSREYGITDVVAIEPHPGNFEVLRRNCEANGVRARLVAAAVGKVDGTTQFESGSASNLGRTGSGGSDVPVVAIGRVGDELGFERSLVKIDVEGAERDLFDPSVIEWIDPFAIVVMEMHPQYVDIAPLIERIVRRGFAYFPPWEETVGHTRAKRERLFVRQPSSLSR